MFRKKFLICWKLLTTEVNKELTCLHYFGEIGKWLYCTDLHVFLRSGLAISLFFFLQHGEKSLSMHVSKGDLLFSFNVKGSQKRKLVLITNVPKLSQNVNNLKSETTFWKHAECFKGFLGCKYWMISHFISFIALMLWSVQTLRP